MARLARLSLAGYPHHIIQRGHNRQAVFVDEADYAAYLRLLHDAARRHRVAIHAWQLLPDQIHVIATPEQADGVPKMMQDVGRAYVRGFNNRHLRSGTLWEGRYRCTVLEPDVWLLPSMVCVDWLAVQAGLVEEPQQWLWSTCAAYLGLVPTNGITIPAQFWRLGNTPFARETAWAQQLHAPQALAVQNTLLEHALHGWVQGSPKFLHDVAEQVGRRIIAGKAGRPKKLLSNSVLDMSPINTQ